MKQKQMMIMAMTVTMVAMMIFMELVLWMHTALVKVMNMVGEVDLLPFVNNSRTENRFSFMPLYPRLFSVLRYV